MRNRILGNLTTAAALMVALGFGGTAQAQINVLTVDVTPLVSPGFSSFGPQNTMGMALNAVDLGADFTVTEVTPAFFSAMPLAALAAFDLIAINNHPARIAGGIGTTYQQVTGCDNGRTMLTSHDAPRFHMNAPTPGPPLFAGNEPFGARDFVRQAALWAGGVPGQTGLLIFNDAAAGFVGGLGWANLELGPLPAAWGITDLNANIGGGLLFDGGYTLFTPTGLANPAYAGLSDVRFAPFTLSSFSANIGDASFQNIFGSFNAALFTPTEVIRNSGVLDVGGFLVANNATDAPNGTAITLICEPAGECDPRTQGYWHRQCLGIDGADGGIDPGRNGRGPSEVFEPDFAALIASVEIELQASIGFIGPACAGGMDADPPRDKQEKAIKQYTALLFNVESNRMQCGNIDVSAAGCTSTNVADLITEIADLINAGDFKQASDCAAFANEGF